MFKKFDTVKFIKDNLKELSFFETLKKLYETVYINSYTRLLNESYIEFKEQYDELFLLFPKKDFKYFNLYFSNKLNKCPVCGKYCIKETCSKECSKKYNYTYKEFDNYLKENDFETSLRMLLESHGANNFTKNISKLYFLYKEDFDTLLKKIGSEDLTYINLYLQDKLCKCKICGKTIKKPRIYCSYECENKGKDFDKINSKKDYILIGKNISKSLKDVDFEKAWEKRKKTRLEKYGNENYTNIEKARQTCLEKYGKESYFSTDEFKKYISKNYNAKSEEEKNLIHQKRIKTNLKKYGNTNNAWKHFKNIENFNKNFIEKKFICDGILDIENYSKYFGIHATTAYYYLRKWNIKYRKHSISLSEIKLFKWIPIENKIANTRKIITPYELDIYLPDYNLAIEYDGIYYHSDKKSDYHLMKTNLCNSKGIQLFHIFDFDNLDIWKSIILNKLKMNNKIQARKCIIKELEYSKVKNFLNDNHLQGACISSINLGLYYNEELVEVMTFSKPRFDKNYDYELIRLCTKKFNYVTGGASKLFNYFKKKYNGTIISYANKRFSNGNIYETLGFKKIKESKPNYWYVRDGEVLSRYKCQKHKLEDLLEDYNPELSEFDNMSNNGYLRIYDCGNIVYKYV